MNDITHPLNLTTDQISFLYNFMRDCKYFPDPADNVENTLHVAVTELYEDVCVQYELTEAERSFYYSFGYYPKNKNDGIFWETFRHKYNQNHCIES